MRAALKPNGADAYWVGRFGLIRCLVLIPLSPETRDIYPTTNEKTGVQGDLKGFGAPASVPPAPVWLSLLRRSELSRRYCVLLVLIRRRRCP